MINYDALFAGLWDAARRGVSDFYDDAEGLLTDALMSGNDFDTGWYSVNKEVQSGRIVRKGETFTCMVYITDDFDTEGSDEVSFDIPEIREIGNWMCADVALSRIRESLDLALEGAEQSRKENAVYAGFSIGPVNPETGKNTWKYTYIAPIGDGLCMDYPPGDNYLEWGWDEDQPDIPSHVKEALEAWINAWCYGGLESGPVQDLNGVIVDGWRVDPWRY